MKLATLSLLLLAIGCAKKDIAPIRIEAIASGEEVQTELTIPGYSFTGTAASELMYEDGEGMLEMTSEKRRFNVNNILRVVAVNNTTIEIANFAPVDITGI